ncbi:hypothetical protein [Halioxenophilus sp. WMMB6]|uniref:hypothetical protein n=1 Tax=Halioxenophilus sp. WMMB6 TaxID=3073815 RepID=UPI00295EB3E5|nr:hypothetical protein [Halioxenophilus sp. WMMB6]
MRTFRNNLHSLTAACLCASLSLFAQGQTFEPVAADFDIENAVTLLPPTTVSRAQPNNAELGPAVTNVSDDTNPIPAAVAQPLAAASPVGSFTSVASPITAGPNAGPVYPIQARQLAVQEQQLARIERVEAGLNKLVRKQSFSKSLMGTIISAAATADPIFAVAGGLAGLLIGKAEDYKETERKNNEIREQILGKSPYYYTDEELRLAAYAGTQLDPLLLRPEQLRSYANYVMEARTRTKVTDWPSVGPNAQPGPGGQMLDYQTVSLTQAPTQASAAVSFTAEQCYGHLQAANGGSATVSSPGLQNASVVTTTSNRRSLSAYDRRTLARYCFYSLR